MANLAIVGSHSVNGVSEIHTELLRTNVFPDFDAFRPELFVNVTNGITPRRWLQHANPRLSGLIHDAIGTEWTRDLGQLRRLRASADDAVFRARFRAVKQENKRRLARLIHDRLGLSVNAESLIDVQINGCTSTSANC